MTVPETDNAAPGSDPSTTTEPGSDPLTTSVADSDAVPGGSDPSGSAERDAGARVEADLDALLAETQRERDEYLDLARRARADFENYRKRGAKEAAEAERRGRARLAEGLVSVLDNLERALQSAGVNPDGDAATSGEQPSEEVSAHTAFAQGVALVYRDLRTGLQRGGVEAFDPKGEAFDPTCHEAISTQPVEGAESGSVLETLEKGYRIDGQVLRPARVIVSE